MPGFSDFFYSDFYKGSERKYLTDKGDSHNYINGYYDSEFSNLREDRINILELGIAYCGSVILWRDWFFNGNIFAIENDPNLYREIEGIRIILSDAYTEETLNLLSDIEFDYIIDDGPHTVESQIFSVKNWTKKLKIGGKLIIEDIQDFKNIHLLEEQTQYKTRVIDLRETLNKKYDDVIFEVTKNF